MLFPNVMDKIRKEMGLQEPPQMDKTKQEERYSKNLCAVLVSYNTMEIHRSEISSSNFVCCFLNLYLKNCQIVR